MTADRWTTAGSSLDLSSGVLMGVVNVTPDSFSDGGLHLDSDAAIARGLQMAREGAAIVDVGGESTRPGSGGISADEEMHRVLPVVGELAANGLVVSIDTSKPEVARAALGEGAQIVNDVNGLRAEGMTEVVAGASCGVVIMHMRGSPRDMQLSPTYDDVVSEVERFLVDKAHLLTEAGVAHDRIAIDPGIGFGKTLEHNIALLGSLGRLASHKFPVVLGTSRKSFLAKLTGLENPADRDGVTAVTTALGYASGARVFRVHNVAESRRALEVASAIVATS